MSRLTAAVVRKSEPMPPSPPSLDTAAANSADVQVPMGARMIGTSMPRMSQSAVFNIAPSPLGPEASCVKATATGKSYSITSSARPSNVGGMVRPSILAACALMTKLELARLHDREVGRFRAFEDAADVDPYLMPRIRDVGPVAHQSADFSEFAVCKCSQRNCRPSESLSRACLLPMANGWPRL